MRNGWLIALLVLGVVGFAAFAAWAAEAAEDDDEKEVKVKLGDCPKAVQETLKRESAGGQIKEIEKETKNGKVIYEAEVVIDGKTYEIKVAANGKLISKKLDEDEEEDKD